MKMFLRTNSFTFILLTAALIKESLTCFTEDESEITKVKSGSSFYQECRCEDKDPSGVHLKWFDVKDKEVQELGPGTKSNVYAEWLDQEVYGLYISNVTKSISGAYKCVTLYNGQHYMKVFNIEAYDPPYFVNTAEVQYVVNGKDDLVVCEARGEAEPFISWHKNEDGFIEISDDDKYEVITSRGLVIKNVTKEDQGVYKCTASDLETGEGIDRDIKVEVAYMPKIDGLIATPEATVVVGESLSIECVADGTPHPEYIWRKISELVPSEVNVTWHQITNSILFDSVVAEDSGTYECTALNGVGNATKTISIEVLIAPEITQFNNVSVLEGESPQIICKATGRPRPKITIAFQGDPSDDNKGIYWNVNDTGDFETTFQLSFNQALRTHQGLYFCNASNEVDFKSEVMYMSVSHKPYFETTSETLWAWIGKTVNLNCEHDSNPVSQIIWRYQGNDISTAEQVEINRMLEEKLSSGFGVNMPIDIDKPSLYGIYECTARNEYGEGTKTITLQEAFVPPPIQNAAILEVTPTSAMFDIIGPNEVNGPRVIGFTAEYDESDNYQITDIHVNRTWSIDRPYKVDKLKANTTYYIKFAAVNDVGAGQWSESLEFSTPETFVPMPPTWDTEFDTVIATKNNQVISWKTPGNIGEPIDYYALRYCPMMDSVIQEDSCVEEIIKSTEFQVAGLGHNRTLYVELIAHNSQGNSSAAHLYVILPAEGLEPALSAGALIGLSILAIFLCLLLLDILLLLWRKQGIIANCYYKKNKKRNEDTITSRYVKFANPHWGHVVNYAQQLDNLIKDKKGLLNNGESTSGESLKRPNNGHKEYEYDKTTGVITGKHSAV